MSVTISGNGTITGLSAGGLPDGTVTAADLASTLDLTGKTVTLPAGVGGKVLQLVQFSSSTYQTTTSTAFVDSNITASITPTSASNKILVLCLVNGAGKGNGNASGGSNYRIIRGASTQIKYLMNGFGWTAQAEYFFASLSGLVLDEPATTSSVTYKLQYSAQNSGTFASVNWYDTTAATTSTIVLMEIAA